MDRVFLDANVIFSAAYRDDSGLRSLWRKRGVQLVTSSYAVEEARRNLPANRLKSFAELVQDLEVTGALPSLPVPSPVLQLPAKDQPILLAAVAAQCTHLVTGDQTHFGPWYGQRVAGVLIQRPAEYLASARLPPAPP